MLPVDDLVAQIEVSKVRDLADELDINYVTSDWDFTPDREIELLFLGLKDAADVTRLEDGIRANFTQQ